MISKRYMGETYDKLLESKGTYTGVCVCPLSNVLVSFKSTMLVYND